MLLEALDYSCRSTMIKFKFKKKWMLLSSIGHDISLIKL